MTTRLDPILVVDDSPELLDLIQILISNAGYPAVTTQSPVQALELAKTRRFSALFTDLVMPVLDGQRRVVGIVSLGDIATRAGGPARDELANTLEDVSLPRRR